MLSVVKVRVKLGFQALLRSDISCGGGEGATVAVGV